MRAITLHQPWASLWLTDAKIHETRTWPTRHRGSLAVHAGLRPMREREISHSLHCLCQDYLGPNYLKNLVTGAVVGVVELIDCVSSNGFVPDPHDLLCGDFSPNRWLWRRGKFVRFETPIDYRGRQGLWTFAATDIHW